jgi:anti-sigma B factor antagonist
MDLQTKKQGGVILLKPLSKNIDATVTTDFKTRVIDLINQGNNSFLLNLSEVDFIDSSGLVAVISILKALNLNNGSIVLCELQSPVLSLFKLTRMDQVFQICTNEKEGFTQLINKKNT